MEAGISRLYGGIHFESGDRFGRLLGREVGEAVYEQAQFFINGNVSTNSIPSPCLAHVEAAF